MREPVNLTVIITSLLQDTGAPQARVKDGQIPTEIKGSVIQGGRCQEPDILCLESRDRLVDSCPDGLSRVAFIADHAAKPSGQVGIEPLHLPALSAGAEINLPSRVVILHSLRLHLRQLLYG